MGHSWTYLGGDLYACDNCGKKATREEIKSDSVPACEKSVSKALNEEMKRIRALAVESIEKTALVAENLEEVRAETLELRSRVDALERGG